jgi:acyl-CoA thioesterase
VPDRSTGPNPTERLLARLDLEEESSRCFIGGSGPRGRGFQDRLYGGLVAAQAYVAASEFGSHSQPPLQLTTSVAAFYGCSQSVFIRRRHVWPPSQLA